MHKFMRISWTIYFFLCLISGIARSQESHSSVSNITTQSEEPTNLPALAPMGIHGANMPEKGHFVLTAMPIFENHSGWLIGTKGVSPSYVASTTLTYIPSTQNPTPFMRVVPQDVTASFENIMLAYGISDKFSALISASVVQKQLYAQTFFGDSGGQPIGGNYIGTKGLADLITNGIYKLYDDKKHRIQASLGLAYPLSPNTETMSLFLPNATYDIERAHYAFQPGARTWDLFPGVVYAGNLNSWSWGLSYRGRLPLAANPQGWRYGDLHEFNGWLGYSVISGVTSTVRINGATQGTIRGLDPQIKGYAVPTDPNFYGGKWIEVFGGSSFEGEIIGLKGYSLEIEAGIPIYQNLNGPQIRNNWQAGAAIKYKM
jgi:hypothetical protein